MVGSVAASLCLIDIASDYYIGMSLCNCYGAFGDAEAMKEWGIQALLKASPGKEGFHITHNQ
jgi:hypothetical protein